MPEIRDSELALPISIVGPLPTRTAGSEPVEQVRTSTSVEGEKVTPSPMTPPEIDLEDEDRQKLALFLDSELYLADSERKPFIDRLARFKEKYRTKFPEFPKDWPIANASQITIPVIRTAVQTLAARIYQTMMAAEPPASMRVKDADFQDFAFDYEEFFSQYCEEKLELGELLDGFTMELIKLGTAVLEPTTRTDQRFEVEYDKVSGNYQKQQREVFSGPIVYHVPLEDFWIRPAFQDPQTVPWCGKEVRLTWTQIKQMALNGEIDPDTIDRLWSWMGEADLNIPKTITTQEKLEKLRPVNRDLIRVHELCLRWDPDKDGNDEEIMVRYHWPSKTILRCWYSGFRRRPWRVARFIRIEHWFYGEGMCEILEALQDEISTMHNQRIDNATIANLRIILVARLIKGLRPGDRLWTGKVVRVQDVKADVGTLQLGEIYPSTERAELLAKSYADQLSGIGEVATGQAKPVSRTTATAQLALLEELNRRFDKVVRGMRKTMQGVYRDLTDLFCELGTGGLAEEWLGPTRGQRLEQFLSLPIDYLSRKVKVQVLSTRSTVNREVEFQSQIAVWQLLLQMWQAISQTAMQLGQMALLPLLAHEFIAAVRPVFKKIMEYADAPDPDKAISVLTVLERVLPSPEDMGGMGGAQASENSATLIDQLQRQTAAGIGGNAGAGGGAPPAQRNGGVATARTPSGPATSGGI